MRTLRISWHRGDRLESRHAALASIARLCIDIALQDPLVGLAAPGTAASELGSPEVLTTEPTTSTIALQAGDEVERRCVQG